MEYWTYLFNNTWLLLHFAVVGFSNLSNSIIELFNMALITHYTILHRTQIVQCNVCQMCILNVMHIIHIHAEIKTVTIGMIRLMIKVIITIPYQKVVKIISRLTYTVMCYVCICQSVCSKGGSHVTTTHDAFDLTKQDPPQTC